MKKTIKMEINEEEILFRLNALTEELEALKRAVKVDYYLGTEIQAWRNGQVLRDVQEMGLLLEKQEKLVQAQMQKASSVEE